jgi:hypothetical protein
MTTGQLILIPFENQYQAFTSDSKLRGQYYTPEELVAMMLDALPLTRDHLIIDPSCGDGSFLRGAVAAIARRFRGEDPAALARYWSRRLLGFEINPGAVAEARDVLRAAFHEQLGVPVEADALRLYQADPLRSSRLADLLQSVGDPGLEGGERLLVVGNPPYVEAKRLTRETKERLKRRHPDAVTGAPDLYLYFLHVCLGWLGEEDQLAFVLPNKLLVNANAQRLRKRLLEEGRLRTLWFATQAGVFDDASVYPIVLFATGAQSGDGRSLEALRIARQSDGGLTRGPGQTVDATWYTWTTTRAVFPPPETPTLREALQEMLQQGQGSRLDGVLDVRWSVSFHRSGLRERYVSPTPPSSPYRQKFLGGGSFSGNGEVVRYGIRWAGWWIDYHQDALRAERNCVPDLALFHQPKVVICQNGRTIRAAYDEQGFVLKDTFLCGLVRDQDHPLCRYPRAIVGLLCSRAIHFFYSHVFYGGHVNGGYLHFLRSFLVDIPLGNWTHGMAKEVAALVQERADGASGDQDQLEERLEALVSGALGLRDDHVREVARWAEGDANWQARERVRAAVPVGAAPST